MVPIELEWKDSRLLTMPFGLKVLTAVNIILVVYGPSTVQQLLGGLKDNQLFFFLC